MNVEAGLVLGVKRPQNFGKFPADTVVVLGQVGQTPVTQLISIVHLKIEVVKKSRNRTVFKIAFTWQG